MMLQSLEQWLKTENRITVISSFCLYFASSTSGLRKGSPILSWKALWGAKTKEPASIFLPAGILSTRFPACLLLLIQSLCWIRRTGPCTINWWYEMTWDRSSSIEYLYIPILKSGLTKTEKDADSTISQKFLFLTYLHEKPLEVWNVNLNTVAPSQRLQNLPLLLMLLSIKRQNNFHPMLAEGNHFYNTSVYCFYFIFKAQLVLLPFHCASLEQSFSLMLRFGFIYHTPSPGNQHFISPWAETCWYSWIIHVRQNGP